ncbi:MAG: discoidin domain-containing protein [Bacteroidales bacterium]|nr:discoidin domain-containing protein [Bacteroidales bacterium]
MQHYFSIQKVLTALFIGMFCLVIPVQSQFTPYDDIPGIIKSYKPAFSDSYPEWAKMLYDNQINFNELERSFQTYMDSHPGEKNPIIRYYKNWRRAISSYVLEDGSIQIPDVEEYQRNLLAAQKAAGVKEKSGTEDNSNWTFIGPKQTFWLNSSGADDAPLSCPWQVNVYSFDVAATNNDILFAGTETGYVNKTVDRGHTWEVSGQGYPFGGGITTVAIHPENPDIVYVSGGKQIHKTTDGGLNWTPMLESADRFGASRLIIDPTQPEKLVAAAGEGLYISTDGGVSWERKWTKATWDVEIKPDDNRIIYGISSAKGSKFELIISKDGGDTFEKDNSFPPDHANHSGALLAVTAANPDIVYATMLVSENNDQFAYIYKGTYADEAWTWLLTKKGEPRSEAGLGGFSTGQGYFDYVLAVSPNDENTVFWGTCTLFKSTDGGVSFAKVGGYGGSFAIHPDVQDIKMLPSGKTWVSTDGGMTITTDDFVSTANSATRINGIIGSDMWGFDQGWNEDLMVGGRYHNGNTAIADFYGDKALRMGGAESPTGWVLKGKSRHVAFNDLGNGWILPKEATGMPEGRFVFSKYPNMDEYGGRRSNIVTHPNYYGILYLGEGNSFWRSSDMGVSYERIHVFPDRVMYLQISYSHPDIIYADVKNRGLYKSEDGGYTWTLKSTLTRYPYGSSNWKGKLFFAISPYDGNKIYVCLQNGTWSADIGKIFKSEDGGDTWTNWTGTVSEYTKGLVIQATQSGKDLVYLFTNSKNGRTAKVHFRRESDEDWTSFSNEYPASMKLNLSLPFFRDSKIRAAGNGGVWESPLQEPGFTPIITPWVERADFNCMLDTIHFDDHSMLNHEGVSWEWSISPAPAYINDANIRNPEVVLGTPGSYSVTLAVTKDGQTYVKTIPDMVSTTTCPSVGDCTNPAELPKDTWRLLYVDSEERNSSGHGINAIDNDPSTIWHTKWSTGTDPYPHEFQVDMVTRFSVHKFIYLPRQSGSNGRIKDWELYVGDDYMNYGDPVATGTWDNNSAPKTVILPETKSGQYWKLVALSEVNGNAWSSAAEFSIVGCNGDTSGSEFDLLDSKISAYPIPTDGLVSLDVPANKEYSYQVLSAQGKLIKHGEIMKNSTSQTINLQEYKSGIYLVRLIDQAGVCYWVKVVKN